MFAKTFGRAPRWIASAPGRVNLIGEHTDYNDGFVLPMAIEHRTAIAGDVSGTQNVTLHSATNGETASFSIGRDMRRGEPSWANYVKGVVAGFSRLGASLEGFHAVIDSDVPLGSGLSSSAALEVAAATLMEAIIGSTIDPTEKARLCQQAEHEFAGVPCGIMDQFISAMGRKDHLLLIDCRSQTGELVPFKDPTLQVLIINTNVRHSLADGEYARRRAQCESAARTLKVRALRDATLDQLEAARTGLDPLIHRRARHVISENLRTTEAARCLRDGCWERLGELMYASHASLRDDYEVSCEELDQVVELARNIGARGGVLGCRMTGGGFGGCAVALVKADQAKTISGQISEGYLDKTRRRADIFVSRPGAGAAVTAGGTHSRSSTWRKPVSSSGKASPPAS
ncbi:MAG: galactokinase [Verrucomicrobia bacterium]|nr:galactokinase [Verrucomicrobiota bacterium]